jgi:RimJ/RimL family protein N-acetyltransferase
MPTEETGSVPADQSAAAVCASPAQAVETRDFVEHHRSALERDEVRHNLILSILERLALDPPPNLRRWSLGASGACAAQSPGYPIVLGELIQAQCRALAEETCDLDYPGVVGPEQTAPWFAERGIELGLTFLEPIPQQIHLLREKPNYPGAPGHARVISPADVELFADWTTAFMREAVPHDPPSSRERLAQIAAEGRHQFWVVDGEPAAMAGIVRRTRHAAAIAGVYTPPSLRRRGYAGSVTAAVVERIFTEGKTAACLYTDLRNPASNRCYAKIGFEPACRSWHYPRARG